MMRTGPALLTALLAILSLSGSPRARGQDPERETPAPVASPRPEDTVVLPKSVPDPLEPFNRLMWSVNEGVLIGVIKPTAKAYRFVVVKPLRVAIANAGRNLTYPGRLINNLLQGNWHGARDESYRFVCNTTTGVGGLLDLATRWKIPKSDADFGLTFGHWGWKPACYIMLPLIGPSNERDTVGLAADTAANPLFYLSPYEFDAGSPETYLSPYGYFSAAVTYNHAADTVEEYVRFIRGEMDPYSVIQYAWTFAREKRVVEFLPAEAQDEASRETLEAVFVAPQDPEFAGRARTRSARIPSTGRKLRFTYWLHPGQAPVVYILPGLGSHRLARPCLALAELVYRQGFTAVCVSSAFHAEFMENASTAALPAYLPVDGRDVHVALTEIDRHLRASYPDRLGGTALLGYSMGAFHALFVAATEPTRAPPLMKFDRYVAINSPVRLLHGASMLDAFYDAPLAWPENERTARIENTFRKVAELSRTGLAPEASFPLGGIESRFLIGLVFRLTLRDILFSSQRRTNFGILQNPLHHLRRDPVYQEILQYSYQDYFARFAAPYYATRGLVGPTTDALAKAGDLRSYEPGLRANTGIRVIANENDFLLPTNDLAWLQEVLGPDRVTLFKQGGHLGNLANPAVRQAILEALKGLSPSTNRATPPR